MHCFASKADRCLNMSLMTSCSVRESEWEFKQLIKTLQKVIHTTPVHQLMSCEAKSYLFVRNKSITDTFFFFFFFKLLLLVKYKCCTHNIAFSTEKVISFESGEKWAQVKHCLQANYNCSKHICWRVLIWEDNREWTLSLKEVLLWIMDSYKLKTP